MNAPASGDGDRTLNFLTTKAIAVGVLVAIVLAIILYFIGVSQGRRQLDAQKTAHDQRIGAIEAELRGARSELAAASARRHVMEARAALYRTAVDLDQRNFGTANEHLQSAAQALGRIAERSGGVPLQQIESLRALIDGTDINVATDLHKQRAQVLEFAAQLDALAVRMEPATPVETPTQTETKSLTETATE